MTVSYALRNHHSIPERTAKKIQKLAEKMGYTPNPMITSLIHNLRLKRNQRQAPVIGYITSYSSSNMWWDNFSVQRAYYEGAKEQCLKLGFKFEHFKLSDYNMSGKQLSRVMRYRNVRGIVCAPVPTDSPELDIDWDLFPCVGMGYSMPSPPIHRITVNHFQSMLVALERITSKGYERIAVITSQRISKRINNLFVAATDLFHRQIPKEHIVPVKINSIHQQTTRELERWVRKQQPDFIFDASDGFCCRAIQNASSESVLYGFPYATTGWDPYIPDRAGINQNSFQIGQAAINALTQLIYSHTTGIPEYQSFTMINGSWMDGPSAPDKTNTASRNSLKKVKAKKQKKAPRQQSTRKNSQP